MTDIHNAPAVSGVHHGIGTSLVAALLAPLHAALRRKAEWEAARRRHPGPTDPEQLPDWIRRDLGI